MYYHDPISIDFRGVFSLHLDEPGIWLSYSIYLARVFSGLTFACGSSVLYWHHSL